MGDYILSCCSAVDLKREHLERRNIPFLCFHFNLGGKDYEDDLGQTLALPDFYQAMVDGAMTNTSQINISQYLDFFKQFLEQGKDVLHVSLSSGISGTVNSARNAAAIASEQYPDRKIYIVDSLAASSGYGLLMDELADLRDRGMSIEEVRDWAEANKNKLHHWFFSTDLTFYVRGGRISKTAGVFGTMLNICPLMNVDYMGRLIPRSKIRTKKRVIREIVERMEQYADDRLNYSGKCYLCNSNCYEDAVAVAQLVEEKFPNLKGKTLINDIGAVIGSHSGPGTVAVFFWGDPRVD